MHKRLSHIVRGFWALGSIGLGCISAQVTGTGTAGTVPIWTGSTSLGNSEIIQRSGKVGVRNAKPAATLDVNGNIHSVTNTSSGSAIRGDMTAIDGSYTEAIEGSTSNTAGAGVRGDATATANSTTIAVLGVASGESGAGVRGDALSATGFAVGVVGTSNSTSGTGTQGYANATSGNTFGVYGGNVSTNGTGIRGDELSTAGVGYTAGVVGTDSDPVGIAIDADETSAIGASTGVRSRVYSNGGTAGLFDNAAAGNILVGAVNGVNKFRVDGTGKGYFDGGTQTSGADFAESVAVHGKTASYAAGDLLAIDASGDRMLTLAQEPYSTRVAGIYSSKPGVLATPHGMDDARQMAEVPLAIVGIVPCKVTVENGPIRAGDLLVSSSLPGYAMRGSDRSRMLGAVVGKALESLANGEGVIEVLVTLQ